MKKVINYLEKINGQNKLTKTQLSFTTFGIFLFLTILVTLPMINHQSNRTQTITNAQAAGNTYYVDATNGNDSNSGTSISTPWKTIAKVNSSTFSPGDSILFKRGETWREQLTPPSSGTAGSPITFDAYGSGANPIMNGSDIISNWTAASSVTDNGAIFTAGGTTENSALGTTANWRGVIASANLSGNATTITLTFKGALSGNGSIGGVGIGERSGPSGNITGPVTRVTFSGGASGITVPYGQEVTSDPITITIDKTKSYIVTYYTPNQSIECNILSGYVLYQKASGPDESQAATVTGYNTTWASYGFVKRINSVTAAVIPHVYQAPGIASAPVHVFRNGVAQTPATSIGTLDASHTWFYSSGLYVYSAADPASDGSMWTAPQRDFSVNVVGKSYVTIRNIDAGYSKAIGVGTEGSHNIIFDRVNSYHHGSSGITPSYGSSDITITGGSYHDNGGAPDADSNGIGTGGEGAFSTPITIDGVEIYGNVNDNIELYGPSGGVAVITVKDCYIHGGKAGGIRVSGPGVQTLTLQNNIISGTSDHGIITTGAATPNILIYNNTIANNSGSGFCGIQGNVTFKNNIFFNNGVSGWGEINLEQQHGTFASNYNLVYHPSGGPFMIWTNGGAYNWANWKTTSGQDAQSINANPLFTNAGASVFTLQSSSPAIDTGSNLGTSYQFGWDPVSSWPLSVVTANQNNNGAGWEMGAYVYTTNSAPTPTPTPPATPTASPTSTGTPTPIPTNTATPTPSSGDTTAPTVSISSPANGSTISRHSNVTIAATASDNAGVTKVEFLVNSTLKCTDTTSPYSCVWSVPNAKNAQYTITAKAYDTAGNLGTNTILVTAK